MTECNVEFYFLYSWYITEIEFSWKFKCIKKFKCYDRKIIWDIKFRHQKHAKTLKAEDDWDDFFLLPQILSYPFFLAVFLQSFGPLLLLGVLLFDSVLGDDLLQTGQSHFSVRPKLPKQCEVQQSRVGGFRGRWRKEASVIDDGKRTKEQPWARAEREGNKLRVRYSLRQRNKTDWRKTQKN